MSLKLGIGAANAFGPYGAGNSRVAETVYSKLLAKGNELGFSFIDTAKSYGRFSVDYSIPKTMEVGTKVKSIDLLSENELYETFELELRDQGLAEYSYVLLHDLDWVKDTANCLRVFESLKTKGLTHQLGISVYEPSEFLAVLELFDWDIVQAPFSLLDQRFGELLLNCSLANRNIEFMARSLLLQGIIGLHKAPDFARGIGPELGKINVFTSFDIKQKISLSRHLLKLYGVSSAVIGVERMEHLVDWADSERLVDTRIATLTIENMKQFAAVKTMEIDPRQWCKV